MGAAFGHRSAKTSSHEVFQERFSAISVETARLLGSSLRVIDRYTNTHRRSKKSMNNGLRTNTVSSDVNVVGIFFCDNLRPLLGKR